MGQEYIYTESVTLQVGVQGLSVLQIFWSPACVNSMRNKFEILQGDESSVVNKDWTCKDKDQTYKDKDYTCNDKDKDLTHKNKDKDFTYSYLLQVAAKPTITIKQQQWTQSENSQHMTVKPITPNK